MTTALQLLNVARSQLSVPMGAPGVPYAVENSCAKFTKWCYNQVGIHDYDEPLESPAQQAVIFKQQSRYDSIPAIGAQIFIDLTGQGQQVLHTGFIDEIRPGALSTIEFNAPEGGPNTVKYHTRGLVGDGFTLGFGHPFYEELVMPKWDPALKINVCNELACPTGGVWLLSPDGAVFAFGSAPYYGGANAPYFANRQAAQLILANPDPAQWSTTNPPYRVISTDGRRYGDGGF